MIEMYLLNEDTGQEARLSCPFCKQNHAVTWNDEEESDDFLCIECNRIFDVDFVDGEILDKGIKR